MVDQRLRRNHLLMLLKKRTVIGDNELYEMMRSRQVYHVQTELRKELDRTIKALKNAERLRVAGFMTQRAMFLKRVDVRQRNLRRLTNVKASMKELQPKGETDESEEEDEEGDTYLWYPDSSRVVNEDETHDPTNIRVTIRPNQQDPESVAAIKQIVTSTDNDNIHVKSRKKEDIFCLPSVNKEWMENIQEVPKKSMSKEVTNTKKVPEARTQHRELEVPKRQDNIAPPNVTSLPDRSIHFRTAIQDHSNIIRVPGNISKSKDLVNSISQSISETKDKGLSVNDGWTDNTSPSNTKRTKAKRKKMPIENVQTTVSVKKQEEECKENQNKNVLRFLPACSDALNRAEKTPFDCSHTRDATPVDNMKVGSDSRPTVRPNKKKECTKLVVHPINVGKGHSEFALGQRDHTAPSGELTSLAAVKLPYLQRSQSHPKVELRTSKSNVTKSQPLPGPMERTVTMVYIEDPEHDPDPPASQFDFEAWLAYNRKKRGYTMILDEKPYADSDTKDKLGKSDQSKSESKNNVRFSLRQQRASQALTGSGKDNRPKTFREKSMEWYMNFLKAKHNMEQSHDHHERKDNFKSHANFSFWSRYNVIPGISRQANASMDMDGHSGMKDRLNMALVGHYPHLFTKESKDQKLQKLRNQSKILQVRVQNFMRP